MDINGFLSDHAPLVIGGLLVALLAASDHRLITERQLLGGVACTVTLAAYISAAEGDPGWGTLLILAVAAALWTAVYRTRPVRADGSHEAL